MTIGGSLAELAAVNRPEQFTIMETAMTMLAASPAVTHLMIYGSIAAGTSDRLSDVDLVVGIRERDFARFAQAQDDLVAAQLGQVLPGWPDTTIPPLGGLGWVHLIQHAGMLYQLDLYLAPSRRVRDITARTRGRLIYTAPDAGRPDPDDDARAAAFVAAALAAEPEPAHLVVRLLVLAWMIRRRISRGQRFMAYKETHEFVAAARALIRASLSPHTAYLGWYHLDEHLGGTPIGRSCLDLLAELAARPAVPTARDLSRMLDIAFRLAELTVPDVTDALSPGIDSYRHYLAQR